MFKSIFSKVFVLLTVVSLLFAGSNAFAKELPHQFDYKGEDYPEYETYFKDYFDKLNSAFEPEKHFSKLTDMYVEYYYKIHRDGTISDFHMYESTSEDYIYLSKLLLPLYRKKMKDDSPKFDEYVKNIIFNNPQPVFPKDLPYDQFWINARFSYIPRRIYLTSQKNEPRYKFDAYGYIKEDGFIVYPQWNINISREKDSNI